MSIEAAQIAAEEIHAHLHGLPDHSETSKIWQAQAILAARDPFPMAAIPCTGLCREASMFAVAMLEMAGWPGWRMTSGQFDLADVDDIPLDIHDHHVYGDAMVHHTWVVNRSEGILMDLTAAQFGPAVCPGDAPLVIPLEHARGWWQDSEPTDWHTDPEVTSTVDAWLGLPVCENATEAFDITDPAVLALAERLREISCPSAPALRMAI